MAERGQSDDIVLATENDPKRTFISHSLVYVRLARNRYGLPCGGGSSIYTKTLYAGWSDMDFNSHMKNTAYLDKTADVRQMFLIENGFPVEEFTRLRIGPVVMKDEIEYFREIGLQQKIDVTYALAGHALDGSRFLLRHEIFRPDGELSARVLSAGGWLDLDKRKIVAPPPALFAAMDSLERTDDFVVLASSVRDE